MQETGSPSIAEEADSLAQAEGMSKSPASQARIPRTQPRTAKKSRFHPGFNNPGSSVSPLQSLLALQIFEATPSTFFDAEL